MDVSIERLAAKALLETDKENASDPEIKKGLSIVLGFSKTHKVLCYGGTALNNLLPKSEQFYDSKYDIPDYDFFSETPQVHAMKIADRLANAGINSVEVKPASHLGTFKVFADYIGVADITFLDKSIFEKLWKSRVEKDGVSYVPPNFLRMSVYLELSRPKGDTSRWPKVYSRLMLLNKHYPNVSDCPVEAETKMNDDEYTRIKSLLISHKSVLLGFNAVSLQQRKQNGWQFPLDVITDKPESLLKEINEIVKGKIESHEAYNEILPAHSDIKKDGKLLIRLYNTDACHSFHKISSGLRIASIPTLLQFFFAMLYGDNHIRENISEHRLLCVAEHLMDMAHNSGSRRYKLLTPLECIGKQETIIDIKKHKSHLYKKLSTNKNSAEYLKNFFSYEPTQLTKTRRLKVRAQLRKTLKN